MKFWGLDRFGWLGFPGGRGGRGIREEGGLTGEHRKYESSPVRRKLRPKQNKLTQT